MNDDTSAESDVSDPPAEWAIVELMGHRRLAGLVTDVERFGTRMMRLDVPDAEGTIRATQFYAPAALYCLTPCDEATARRAANPPGWQPPVALELGDGQDDDDDGESW